MLSMDSGFRVPSPLMLQYIALQEQAPHHIFPDGGDLIVLDHVGKILPGAFQHLAGLSGIEDVFSEKCNKIRSLYR